MNSVIEDAFLKAGLLNYEKLSSESEMTTNTVKSDESQFSLETFTSESDKISRKYPIQEIKCSWKYDYDEVEKLIAKLEEYEEQLSHNHNEEQNNTSELSSDNSTSSSKLVVIQTNSNMALGAITPHDLESKIITGLSLVSVLTPKKEINAIQIESPKKSVESAPEKEEVKLQEIVNKQVLQDKVKKPYMSMEQIKSLKKTPDVFSNDHASRPSMQLKPTTKNKSSTFDRKLESLMNIYSDVQSAMDFINDELNKNNIFRQIRLYGTVEEFSDKECPAKLLKIIETRSKTFNEAIIPPSFIVVYLFTKPFLVMKKSVNDYGLTEGVTYDTVRYHLDKYEGDKSVVTKFTDSLRDEILNFNDPKNVAIKIHNYIQKAIEFGLIS